jgi:uncharacterized SAM-dependent methyltransferase
MNTESLLTETEIAQELADSMEARDLPEKFFYWHPLSVRAWLALARDASFDGLRRLWATAAVKSPSLTEHFGANTSIVSFGAGDGSKDRLVLEALRVAGREIKYFPVDASQALLEVACAAAEDADLEVLGIKADISSPVHLVLASDAAESPKLFLMSGNTLAGFDPLDEARHLAECLHPGDRLILDAELFVEGARADSPALLDFALAPLAGLGVTADDGEVRMEWKHDERHGGLHVLARHFRAARDLRITALPEELALQRGERISLNFQYFFSAEAFRWLLGQHAGLKILDESLSDDRRFMALVCSR